MNHSEYEFHQCRVCSGGFTSGPKNHALHHLWTKCPFALVEDCADDKVILLKMRRIDAMGTSRPTAAASAALADSENNNNNGNGSSSAKKNVPTLNGDDVYIIRSDYCRPGDDTDNLFTEPFSWEEKRSFFVLANGSCSTACLNDFIVDVFHADPEHCAVRNKTEFKASVRGSTLASSPFPTTATAAGSSNFKDLDDSKKGMKRRQPATLQELRMWGPGCNIVHHFSIGRAVSCFVAIEVHDVMGRKRLRPSDGEKSSSGCIKQHHLPAAATATATATAQKKESIRMLAEPLWSNADGSRIELGSSAPSSNRRRPRDSSDSDSESSGNSSRGTSSSSSSSRGNGTKKPSSLSVSLSRNEADEDLLPLRVHLIREDWSWNLLDRLLELPCEWRQKTVREVADEILTQYCQIKFKSLFNLQAAATSSNALSSMAMRDQDPGAAPFVVQNGWTYNPNNSERSQLKPFYSISDAVFYSSEIVVFQVLQESKATTTTTTTTAVVTNSAAAVARRDEEQQSDDDDDDDGENTGDINNRGGINHSDRSSSAPLPGHTVSPQLMSSQQQKRDVDDSNHSLCGGYAASPPPKSLLALSASKKSAFEEAAAAASTSAQRRRGSDDTTFPVCELSLLQRQQQQEKQKSQLNSSACDGVVAYGSQRTPATSTFSSCGSENEEEESREAFGRRLFAEAMRHFGSGEDASAVGFTLTQDGIFRWKKF